MRLGDEDSEDDLKLVTGIGVPSACTIVIIAGNKFTNVNPRKPLSNLNLTVSD